MTLIPDVGGYVRIVLAYVDLVILIALLLFFASLPMIGRGASSYAAGRSAPAAPLRTPQTSGEVGTAARASASPVQPRGGAR